MKVAVTGGTGFVGAHSVRALVDAGHDVRLLVQSHDDPVTPLEAVGVPVGSCEVVTGDVRDPGIIGELLRGCDAVLHAAGVVTAGRRHESVMWEVNASATALVLSRAVAARLDPIVHVSSYAALFPPPHPPMGPDSPTASGRSTYGRTKAAADRIARGFQAAGAPVVITYPGSVIGPPAGPRTGVTAAGWAPMLRSGLSVAVEGAVTVIDVRDLAAVHAAVMQPGRGPRRYMCGGETVRFDEMVDLIAEVTGRRIRRVRVSPRVLRGIGRLADGAGRLLPFAPGFSYEAAWMLTAATPTDDSATLTELGLTWRPVRDSLADAMIGVR